jgi:hypothetical protein
MKKLSTPIIGIEIPGQIQNIVNSLFPSKETEVTRERSSLYEQCMDYPLITEPEVLEELKKIPYGKTPGPDRITNELLKEVVRKNPTRLMRIYKRCFKEAYPVKWKEANLLLMSRLGKKPDDPSGYRPLCMLNTIGKLLKKIIARHLNRHLEETKALTDAQYGFRQKKSTVNAISILLTIVNESNRKGDVVGMLTLDVKNAFNSGRWTKISKVLKNTNTPIYLQNIIGVYHSRSSIPSEPRSLTGLCIGTIFMERYVQWVAECRTPDRSRG